MTTNPEKSIFGESDGDEPHLKKLILFCSTYYWRLFVLSILILCAISFHRVFSVILSPVITTGVVVDLITQKEYISVKYGHMRIRTQTVEFYYAGKQYRIIGGSDEANAAVGRTVDVIFSKNAPENGAEYSFEGLLDWPLASIFFRVWLCLTACMLAMARLDSNFKVLTIDFSKLTLVRILLILALLIALPIISINFITLAVIGIIFIVAAFWETKVMEPNEDSVFSRMPNFRILQLSRKNMMLIALPILLVPFIPNGKLLMMGIRTSAVITNEMIFANDVHMYRAAIFQIGGNEYKVPVQDFDYDQREMIGHSVPVIYLPSDPGNSSLYTLHALYVNAWLIPAGMALIFLVAWFFATRIPDDEGTYDE